MTERTVVVIGFNGFQALDLVGPLEVFSKANVHRPASVAGYTIVLASPDGADIASNSGLSVSGFVGLEETPGADTILIAGGCEAALRAAIAGPNLLPWLRAQRGVARRIASVCTGAFVLAAAGLLDGKRATTHWASADRLEQLFPSVQVEPDALFTGESGVYTSAGVTAGIDLCLNLVEEDLGSAVALAVARDLVLFLRRPGGQAQFSASLAAQAASTPKIRALLAWMVERLEDDLSGPVLAERAGMSERTFRRRFVAETGVTPAHHVETLRLDRAKLYLETTDWPLSRVAERSGLGSVPTLMRTFRRRLNVTPEAYRVRFGGRN